jgi:ribonuclease Z
MDINIVFLGTGAAVPTAKRGLPAVLLIRGNEHILFDCGEGIQRQMIQAKISIHKKMSIFITHLHGDHMLGLPGLLQTMALMDRLKPVDIYAPQGLATLLECLRNTLQFQLTFDVNVHEVNAAEVICENEEYTVASTPSNHAVTSFCYSFTEKPRIGRFHPEKAKVLGVPKGEAWSQLQHGCNYTLPNGQVIKPQDLTDSPRTGRKIVYTGDTKPFETFASFASDADLIIHEGTFDDKLVENANRDGHSTAGQAATQAKAAKAKQLALTHISARYTDTTLLQEQAQKIFPNTLVAYDFLELTLPLSE